MSRRQYEHVAASRKADAVKMLIHYFELVSPRPLEGDHRAEIESIVDLIVDAAVAQMRAEAKS